MSEHEVRLPSEGVRDEARRAIEALVLVAEEPLGSNLIGQLLELSPPVVEELCRQLAAEHAAEGRGFQLVRVAGGWRYLPVKPHQCEALGELFDDRRADESAAPGDDYNVFLMVHH